MTGQVNGKPAYIKKAIERSLKNLGTHYLDVYYLHRLDQTTPVEETIAAMAELVKEGKVKYIGLSEVSSETIKKAHAVHPLTAVETEFSLFERHVEEDGILTTLQELGIGLVAYSPLSRGFLNGQIKSPDDFAENDFRKNIPRYQGEQFYKNIELINEIKKIATKKGVTSSQLAIAWVLSKGAVAIPGTKRVKYIEENIAASNVTLSAEEMQDLENIVPLGVSTGARYDAASLAGIDK
jgi:aryl-alcohol dehydrogenase-like predicted oxidoreductase